MRRVYICILMLLLAATACGEPSTPPTSVPTATSIETPSRGFLMGVAGLIPANFPDSSHEDWLAMYASLPETGELFGVYTLWADSTETEGEIPQVVHTVFGLAESYDFTPLVALGTFRDAQPGGVEPTIAWTDANQVSRFQQTAVAIAAQYQPTHLALGVEINRLYDHDTQDFLAFTTAYAEIYDAVKIVSSHTKVFTIFQLETLRGAGYLTGTSEGRQPHWELLDLFGERLDLAVFTTYPFFDYTAPEDIPDDYYLTITEYTALPIGFTEIGWPSAPLSSFPDSAFGGSQTEQVAFAQRFFELTNGLDLALALWSFPNDVGSAINPAFETISLRQNNGTPKPAFEIWHSMVGINSPE